MNILDRLSITGKITYTSLRNLNLLTATLQFAQGILILLLSDPSKGLRPLTTNYLTNDKLAGQQLVAASHHISDFNLAYLIAAVFFVNAIAHLLAATRLRKVYESSLGRGVNRVRWIDFALSSGLMVVLVALVAGVYDISTLIMIFGLTALMGLTTALIEINKPVQLNYWLGIFAGALPWLVIVVYMVGAHIWGFNVPLYVNWVAISLFLLFGMIAANFYLQYKRLGRWENYLFGERMYIFLSFAAKTALAWQIFAGTLR